MVVRYWLPLALIKDIGVNYPNTEDLIVCNINDSCCRDIDTYRDNRKMLFPVGRVFATCRQLEQAIQHFSNGWNALTEEKWYTSKIYD